ncbi:formylglycine-generating enzyme family protein [Acaryochloris sp. IP29b_bin.137]|uniref:formylglycine-generating enzyme family protein n=1 Tax=Acaryochloris sp. IP29b_bin.137 TaxID=2969217 RepID=UPI002608DA68|nr:formylglycine-generating enzyme family protein [Acaryochloris sp. IP29b_bin.137]
MYPELASTHPPELKIERSKIQVQAIREPLDQKVDLVLIQIPGGEFMMGSPNNEEKRKDCEGPRHLVSINNFWMGQYPITQAQWRIVAQYERVSRDLDPDPSEFKGDLNPVEQVSWYDAVEFCDRLGQQTGRNYRLPTEAEWEYACRSGTTTPFSFGRTLTPEVSNYDSTYAYDVGPKAMYREKTTPVDFFGLANYFGICDMHGNVFDWCLDHWHHDYIGAPIDGTAWTTEDSSSKRMLRGGSWTNDPIYCRSASRSYCKDPNAYGENIGFRVVLTPR